MTEWGVNVKGLSRAALLDPVCKIITLSKNPLTFAYFSRLTINTCLVRVEGYSVPITDSMNRFRYNLVLMERLEPGLRI